MKASRFKYAYRESASKLHRQVGELLRTYPLFALHKSYQEYPVERVCSTYRYRGQHFDWVIPSLHLVVECMGEQHERPVAFGGNNDVAREQFEGTIRRDALKKEAAEQEGYIYLTVWYYENKTITGALLWKRYIDALLAEPQNTERNS